MSRYSTMFANCQAQNRIAFIPFVMLGDPDFDESFKIISQLVESGADALELGMPFSDPVADGPVIQSAAIRALEKGFTQQRGFELLAKVRAAFPDIAIGLLLYANLVYHKGISEFYRRCAELNIDSVLIADVPIRESELFDKAAAEFNIDSVHILPPNASEKTLNNVAKKSRGYTYVLGRAGVTGTDQSAVMPSGNSINELKNLAAAPPIMGFGISKPEQVVAAAEHGFAGAISGSAVVKIIEANLSNSDAMLSALNEFIKSMCDATKLP